MSFFNLLKTEETNPKTSKNPKMTKLKKDSTPDFVKGPLKNLLFAKKIWVTFDVFAIFGHFWAKISIFLGFRPVLDP